MLASSDFANVRGSWESGVTMLGVPAAWTRAKAAGAAANLTVGFKTAGVKDVEIVNAYGINAIILTVRAIDVTVPPEKFDTFVVSGQRITADAVHPVHLNGSVIGWKIYARGNN